VGEQPTLMTTPTVTVPPEPKRHWWSALGLATVGAVAAQMVKAEEASASCPCTPVQCCCLGNYKNQCPYNDSDKASFYCTQGYQKAWGCLAGSRKVVCGECTTVNTNCFDTNIDCVWYCSIWYFFDCGCQQ
jgi:hypothetical protein